MGKSRETFSKKEKEKKRQKKRKDKEEKKEERKLNSNKGKSFEEMLAYVDENGNLSDVPPDPRKKKEIKTEDILISTPKEAAEDPTRTGTVTFFNEEKGYGFIKDSVTKEGVFVHINVLKAPLKENDKVTFEIELDERGAHAIAVKHVEPEPKEPKEPKA